ncbi:MAG: alpha-amylase [Ardenticatenaceae bacterium]|nr:alpha-amylase [Ardenticatenaceae bacterium]MCB8988331.1 alpha-amylase [Ardenticatenaceae bacterium]
MPTAVEVTAVSTLNEASLSPRGPVQPSPADWRDQTLYFLLPDRFSDGREGERPLFDRTQPEQCQPLSKAAWMAAGNTFQGGTLRGIRSKLDYLRDLGVTALWIGPVWRQRADLQTYHGYGIQNFLDVDPRFGTRQDLRDLVDAAHAHGLYVLLDIIYNHTGNNWFYDDNGRAADTMPYRYSPPYPVHGWRSAAGGIVQSPTDIDDAVWPREFQNLSWYTRAGSISSWDPAAWEDPLHPETEFRRGDFFELKDLDLTRREPLAALIKVYQYWIAVSDCDGFRIDTVKHLPAEASRIFCGAIKEFAEAIGKDNFLLLGEVAGGETMARDYLEIFGRNIDAFLDIGGPPAQIAGLAKGLSHPLNFFDQYTGHDILGSHRETGRYHVSVLDDHDMVGRRKARFAADSSLDTLAQQTAHAVGVQLTTLGMPCIYYGTEQAFNGSQSQHDFDVESALTYEDRYIREAMFGATFGAFETSGCHFFDPNHPTYLRVAAIARVRNRPDRVGLALRRGRQYVRETSGGGERPFTIPNAGELVAWSRILFDQEVVVALNTHGLEGRGAFVTIDAGLHSSGAPLTVLYRSDWSDAQLRRPLDDETVSINRFEGRATVRLDLPPASMVILA